MALLYLPIKYHDASVSEVYLFLFNRFCDASSFDLKYQLKEKLMDSFMLNLACHLTYLMASLIPLLRPLSRTCVGILQSAFSFWNDAFANIRWMSPRWAKQGQGFLRVESDTSYNLCIWSLCYVLTILHREWICLFNSEVWLGDHSSQLSFFFKGVIWWTRSGAPFHVVSRFMVSILACSVTPVSSDFPK